jgi:hypothetical protein
VAVPVDEHWPAGKRGIGQQDTASQRLKAFMKQAGGVNECASGYADKRRRHRRPHC